ncbi:MAG TPA: hypothetical protein VFS47_10210 [Steroidobacteraceae bacterium]|nr:hypothetical protein [Steroidobacteraceae bacterium]
MNAHGYISMSDRLRWMLWRLDGLWLAVEVLVQQESRRVNKQDVCRMGPSYRSP